MTVTPAVLQCQLTITPAVLQSVDSNTCSTSVTVYSNTCSTSVTVHSNTCSSSMTVDSNICSQNIQRWIEANQLQRSGMSQQFGNTLCRYENPNTGAVLTQFEPSTRAVQLPFQYLLSYTFSCSVGSGLRRGRQKRRCGSSISRNFKSVSSRGKCSQLMTVWHGREDMLVRQISELPIQFCVIARAEPAARMSSVDVNGAPPSAPAMLDFYIKI
jgi:hypothetical protein